SKPYLAYEEADTDESEPGERQVPPTARPDRKGGLRFAVYCLEQDIGSVSEEASGRMNLTYWFTRRICFPFSTSLRHSWRPWTNIGQKCENCYEVRMNPKALEIIES